MKTPFRFQLTEYDCVPTTFINAISYLFHRNEIPPLVIQRIYMYTLDTITKRQRIGHGTTGKAVSLLGSWLESYKVSKFSVASEYLEDEKVFFGSGSRITAAINNGGAVLLRVHAGSGEWHYILAIRQEGSYVFCFDPYPKTSKSNENGHLEFLEYGGEQEPNVKISLRRR